MELEGRLLANRYEIIEKIGSGGMATVYKAKCHVLNRYVAIKILRDEFTTDDEFVKRFEVEAQSAASITNANIVSVFDVGVEGSLHYIVMELVQGKTLKEIIVNEHGPLPWKWSVNIAIQIASALEVAHKNHIVHRDIKPHNIIITEDGVAKVTDFGIAKAVSNSTITAFGTTIGSVHYFSPEHAKGGITDAKSDLYSLGVVMYEMLTGKVPFDADTPVSVALKHMQEQPIPPIEKNPKIPKSVNYIILKALEKDKIMRYSSATEMVQDLKMSLKDPEGKFINNKRALEKGEFPTQKIDALYDEKIETSKNRGKETNKFKKFCLKHKKALIVLGVILTLIVTLIISFSLTIGKINKSRPNEVLMPDLVGKTLEEAQKIADDKKIKIKEEEGDYNSEYEAGKIYKQEPQYKNIKINEGTEIIVKVSKGIEKTKMPKVIGELKSDAIEKLKSVKLNAEVIEENSDEVEAGYVIKQEHEKDTELNAGDTVKIYVSKGKKEVVMPSVIGKDIENAKSILSDLKLNVVVVEKEDSSSKSDGTVLEQSVSSNTAITEGTSVELTVKKTEKIKECKIVVNVAKLTGYTAENDSEGNLIEPKNVTVKLFVDGAEYNSFSNVKESDTSFNAGIVSGKGTLTVRITITGKETVSQTQQINLNEVTNYTFTKN